MALRLIGVMFALSLLALGRPLPTCDAQWHSGFVRKLEGANKAIVIPAQHQVVSENWRRIAAVPYIAYMPEKNRLLMLVNCDQGPGGKPVHIAMVMSSDDHGETWSELREVHRDAQGVPVGMGLCLTYLGSGKLMLFAGSRWFSDDYGMTWGNPLPVAPTPDGTVWDMWDPVFVERGSNPELNTRLLETGYSVHPPRGIVEEFTQAYLRESYDNGKTWNAGIAVPQWKGINEVNVVRAANQDLVAACRTELPQRFKQQIDHYEGLGISLSKDNGKTWSPLNLLYEYGRHHPSLVVMPNGEIIMTYVVRAGYPEDPDGFSQFGIEAIVSTDHGATWDLERRYILNRWSSLQKGPNHWICSSQATSTVLLPDGSLLTAYGTGYRYDGSANGSRDVAMVRWKPQ